MSPFAQHTASLNYQCFAMRQPPRNWNHSLGTPWYQGDVLLANNKASATHDARCGIWSA